MASSRAKRVFRVWMDERRARRSGDNDVARATRDIVGPMGWVSSSAWQRLADNMDTYNESFDRHLPPSLHVSERDRVRHGKAVPLRERCIEDATRGRDR